MRSLNRIEIIGNVGGEVRTRQAGQSNVAEFNVATTEKWATGERTDWHRITAWGKLADIIAQYVGKGDKVFIAGSMRYEEYTDKDGNKMTSAKINATEFLMLGSRGDRSERTENPAPRYTETSDLSKPDDELPF